MIYAIILLAVAVIYLLTFYNRQKTLQVRIKASIQEIGNQLKRQANLIPGLVESVKGFMKQEKGIYEDITSARKSVEKAIETNDPKAIDKSQEMINKVLGSLKVIVESNPEIKSSNLVSSLMEELRDTADKLMYARRTLIDLAADFNTAIHTFPGVIIAPLFGFKEEVGLETALSGDHLKVDSSETGTPKINLN